MICGDFNIDRRVENVLTRMLMGKNFKQIVQKPTTYRGNCIDHFYHNISEHIKKVVHKLHYPCFSDHEAICVMLKDFIRELRRRGSRTGRNSCVQAAPQEHKKPE